MFDYREAIVADAPALGALHVACWREAYAGLLPESLLLGLSSEGRAEMWRAVLDAPASFDGTKVFVAEGSGAMIGFGACCDQRDPALAGKGFDGEIGAVYVLRAHQRNGVGARLMALQARDLLERGRGAASLWVLRDNAPARCFYEALGGELCAERVEAELVEVAYGWRDLSRLAAVAGGEGR
ncbi:MAG: GNAT family N-acetyltransferase [Alphaproteobacteria bacterium]|nr:GNAT family N-acetyltransferase [Alphaproteobacteria bacterium]